MTAGGVLYIDGEGIRVFIEQFSDFDIYLTDSEGGRLLIAEFTGCLIALLFVVSFCCTIGIWGDPERAPH